MDMEELIAQNETFLMTFNLIFEFLSNEKSQKQLGKIPKDFYEGVKNYLNSKKSEITKMKEEGRHIIDIRKEVRILKKFREIYTDLLNIRFSKISNIAVKNSLFGAEVLSEESVNLPERNFLNNLKKNILDFKKEVY